MRKLALLISVMLMAIAVHAQVKVLSPTKVKIDSLRKNIVISVFNEIVKDGDLDIYDLTEKKVQEGMSILFRKDISRWHFTQLLAAKRAGYQEYILTFIDVPIKEDTMAKVDPAVTQSYQKVFGKFTKRLPKQRKDTPFSALTTEEELSILLKNPIRLLTIIIVADVKRMCQQQIK